MNSLETILTVAALWAFLLSVVVKGDGERLVWAQLAYLLMLLVVVLLLTT